METWWFLILETVLALALVLMSRNQPFPGPSRRYGYVLLTFAFLFAIGETSPRETTVEVHLYFLLVFGSLGLIRGVHNMLVTRDEVIVAPFAGIMFCVAATALISEQWGDLTKFEEYAGFATIVALGGGQTWLVFRGLLIGRLPLAWSKAGLVALERGQIAGPHGAISCFEKSWDLEEEHLNPMAWVALEKIHRFLENEEESSHWSKRLAESGGQEAVADEWIGAIDAALSRLDFQPNQE